MIVRAKSKLQKKDGLVVVMHVINNRFMVSVRSSSYGYTREVARKSRTRR